MMMALAAGAHAQTATEAFGTVDKALTEKLAIPYTGDVDLDFMNRMLAQHDAAIERAKTVLADSTDAKVRMMAGDMLKTLHADQRVMKEWLALHGPKPQAALPAPMPKAEPAVEAMKAAAPLPVSPSHIVTPSVVPVRVSDSIPPTDIISDSLAVPEVPAPHEAIENTAPKMEFLDGEV